MNGPYHMALLSGAFFCKQDETDLGRTAVDARRRCNWPGPRRALKRGRKPHGFGTCSGFPVSGCGRDLLTAPKSLLETN